MLQRLSADVIGRVRVRCKFRISLRVGIRVRVKVEIALMSAPAFYTFDICIRTSTFYPWPNRSFKP